MRIERIGEAGFRSMGDEWDRVLAASAQDGPFLRHHWLSAWWETYGDGAELAVLAALDGERLVGAMPAFHTRAGRLPPVRAVRFVGDAAVGSTGLSAFALPDAEDAVFEALARHLRGGGSRADVLDLRFMDPGSAFFRVLADTPHAARRDDCGACPRIALPSDWDGYLKMLSKHMRHEVRRSLRRVEERGIELEVLREPAELPRAIDDFLHLHESRMRSKFGPEYAVPAAYASFTARVMSTLLAEDRLRLMFLRNGKRRIAGLYLLRHGDTMYAEQSGFDEAEAKQDVVRALWSQAIRGAIEEGCSTMDMLLGQDRYKSELGATALRPMTGVTVYNPTAAGRLREVRDAVVDRMSRSGVASEAAGAAASGTARAEQRGQPAAPEGDVG